jgi:hypothetical protein
MEIIYAVCLAYIWVNVLLVPYRFKQVLNFKPLNCTTCLSGWLTLAFVGFKWEVLPMMAVAMVAQIVLDGLIRKL